MYCFNFAVCAVTQFSAHDLWNVLWLLFHTLHPLINFEFPFNCLSPSGFHGVKQRFGQHYSCSKYFPQGYSCTPHLSLSPPHSSGQSSFGSAPKLCKLSHFRWFLLIHGFESWASSELVWLNWVRTGIGQGSAGRTRCSPVPGTYRGGHPPTDAFSPCGAVSGLICTSYIQLVLGEDLLCFFGVCLELQCLVCSHFY